MEEIKFVKNNNLKEKPKGVSLGFGNYFTDYMFMYDYTEGIGWHDPRIVPYGPIPFDPAALVLHYAQETFEGLKAFKTRDGVVQIFRPDMNARRFQTSNERLGMPILDETDFIKAITELVKIEQGWIPDEPNSSLYIRPFMFAYQAKLGVHAANHYLFMVILSPVGSYYKEGLKPVNIYVEDKYVRAVKGGSGYAKCGGNYAVSIKAQMDAEKKGYSQVLWLDGIHNKYIEEVGTMNVMFKIGGEIYTSIAKLGEGSVLPGVTRDSMITILKDKGYVVHETDFTIDFLVESAKKGLLEEAFGTGTAAVISPIGKLCYKDNIFFENHNIGPVSQMLFDTLTQIQRGEISDKYNWNYIVK